MSTYEFSVPCLFGLEGIAGDELRRLDIPNVRVENGRVLFSGEARDMAKANICLRTGERVLIVLADFPAKTFEELFQGVYHANLEDFIPKDGSFPVKGHCLNSQLMSVPDCQAIVKKAVSRRLGEKYGVSWLPETGAKYQLQFSIMNDRVQLYLDTSGQGLHKRGYRAVGNDAPLRETLAAAMVQLSGILIGNPPYGQRMLEQQSAQRLYAALGRHLKYADGWKKFIITSEPEFEHYFGRRADKKRKLYNGMIKCDYYMYTDNSRKNQKRDDKK